MAPRVSSRLAAVFAAVFFFCVESSAATTIVVPTGSTDSPTTSTPLSVETTPSTTTVSTTTVTSTQPYEEPPLTINCGNNGTLYSTLGEPFALRCNLSRAMKANELLSVVLAPLPQKTEETAGTPYDIPRHLDGWRPTTRAIYRYNATSKKGALAPSAQIKGLSVATDAESSLNPVAFIVYANRSTIAHMGKYIWRMRDANGTTTEYTADVLFARPPATLIASSANFFLDSDTAPALVVEANGVYPPSAISGKWFIGNDSSVESAGFSTNIKHVVGADGGADVKWSLISAKASRPPSITPWTTVTLIATWTPPKGFESVFPDGNVTLIKVLRPLWIQKPTVDVRYFPPNYIVCRASGVLCNHGRLQWSTGDEIVISTHQTTIAPTQDTKLCALIQVLDPPTDTYLQKSVPYTCTLRGYERIYKWLNDTIELDNTPTRQGRPILICLAAVVGLFVFGSFMAAVISTCLWHSS